MYIHVFTLSPLQDCKVRIYIVIIASLLRAVEHADNIADCTSVRGHRSSMMYTFDSVYDRALIGHAS